MSSEFVVEVIDEEEESDGVNPFKVARVIWYEISGGIGCSSIPTNSVFSAMAHTLYLVNRRCLVGFKQYSFEIRISSLLI